MKNLLRRARATFPVWLVQRADWLVPLRYAKTGKLALLKPGGGAGESLLISDKIVRPRVSAWGILATVLATTWKSCKTDRVWNQGDSVAFYVVITPLVCHIGYLPPLGVRAAYQTLRLMTG